MLNEKVEQATTQYKKPLLNSFKRFKNYFIKTIYTRTHARVCITTVSFPNIYISDHLSQ